MYGINKCRHLTYLNLSNNSIVCIEGLKDIIFLTTLNLSVNSIKSIQNLQSCENLTYLDLSKNEITALTNITFLTKLKILHLNGNKIKSLTHASKYLPISVSQLSLANNLIADLNEISYLHGLEALEILTVEGNPCVQICNDLVFNYRPFVINWCLGLRMLDDYVATHKESLKAEWLYSQGKGRQFRIGEHSQLIEYLAQQCPLTADQDTSEEDEKLTRILHMQRQHKEQFLNEQALGIHQELTIPVKRKVMSKMSQSYHSNETSQTKTPELKTPAITPSKIMYESAPDVLFHSTTNDHIPQSSILPEDVSKAEQLHNSARSPITIEQVAIEIDTNKSNIPFKPPTPHYEDRRARTCDNPPPLSKSTVIRKVSKRATSPCVSTPSPGRAKAPGSFRSKISPSRSCIINSKLTMSKNSSESDTSEEISQLTNKCGASRRGPRSQSQTCSPVYRQKFQTSSVKGTPDFENNRFPVQTTHPFAIQTSLNQMLAMQFGQSEDRLNRAATKIQSLWRGYHVRHCNLRVYRLRQEIRFRRIEDHIHHLHSHMCRLTDFTLRQQKDLLHERELRKMQAEDLRSLHERAKDVQKDVTQLLKVLKLKPMEPSKTSELDSVDSQCMLGRKLKDNKYFPNFESIKGLQDITPDTPSSSVQYSAQAFHENSLFSPSSQTSSVTSAGPDSAFNSIPNRQVIPPSTSDLSDPDSGLQSMVSPNLSMFIELERHICGSGDTLENVTLPSKRKISSDNQDVGQGNGQETEKTTNEESKKVPVANLDNSFSSSLCSDSSSSNLPSGSSGKFMESSTSSSATVASVRSNHNQKSESSIKPTKIDASNSPIFPRSPSQSSCEKPEPRKQDIDCQRPQKPVNFPFDEIPEMDRSRIKNRPSILTKGFLQGTLSNSSTPLDDVNSPQSPCTVEMKGRISHSCSFQSDGFTAAEELSATTTVKLFSARAMSLTSPQSPQTAIQRPLSLGEPQQSLCSPLVIASNVWEKKVQDIDSTFQRLQAQIRDLEGSVGQVGQLGQFWYPALLSDDSKEPRHLIHRMEPNSGKLLLDMPKVNFKCSNNGNSDFLLQTHFARHTANGVPYLPPSNTQKPAQNSEYCRIEELDQEPPNIADRAKCLKLPLHDKMDTDAKSKQ